MRIGGVGSVVTRVNERKGGADAIKSGLIDNDAEVTTKETNAFCHESLRSAPRTRIKANQTGKSA